MYRTNRHSCYNLEYHLVVVTKYRRHVLQGDIEQRLYAITEALMKKYGFTLHNVMCDKDHVHILFEAPPQVCLSKAINNYKTVTSRYIRKEFNETLQKYLWKDSLWSDSYFIGSVSDKTHDIVKEYIKNQQSANPS